MSPLRELPAEDLPAVLRSLIHLLGSHGYSSQTDWLSERLAVVTDVGATPEAIAAAVEELRRVIPGMGGLTDIYLRAATGQETEQANRVLRQLTEQLYELTRPLPGLQNGT